MCGGGACGVGVVVVVPEGCVWWWCLWGGGGSVVVVVVPVGWVWGVWRWWCLRGVCGGGVCGVGVGVWWWCLWGGCGVCAVVVPEGWVWECGGGACGVGVGVWWWCLWGGCGGVVVVVPEGGGGLSPVVEKYKFYAYFDPVVVFFNWVAGESNELAVPLFELRGELSNAAEFGGTHWGEISGMGEENRPAKIQNLDMLN